MKKKTLRIGALVTVVAGILAISPAYAASRDGALARPTRAFVNLNGIDDNQNFGRFIVTYRDGTAVKNNGVAIARNMSNALSSAGLATRTRPVTATYLRKLAIGADLVKTSRKLDRIEAEAFMRQIAADPNVASVSLDVLRRPVRDIRAPQGLKRPAAFAPNEAYFDEDQWNFKAPDGSVTPVGGVANFGGTRVDSAWELADGQGITIAVLDTGITAHPDVDTSLADAGYDFITDSYVSGRDSDDRAAGGWDLGDWTTTAPWVSDSQCVNSSNPAEPSSWHGTHVASTTGAELTNNGIGETGIAYNAKVLPVRVLGHCGGYDSDINDAIVWAAGGHVDGVPDNTHPAQVINLSLGGSGTCPATDPAAQAIAQANALGAVVVVSAGNSNADAANYSPASCPGAITVASVGITSKRAFYSNYGTRVDIAAPGGGIYANDNSSGQQVWDGFVWQALNPGTTTPTPVAQIDEDLDYSGYAGTSQAAPHVSGTVALMQSARLDAELPPLTPAEVLDILKRTAHAPNVAPASNRLIGAGIVDAAAAVEAALASDGGGDDGGDEDAIPLQNKVNATVSGAAGSETLYSFDASAGSVLSILTLGGTGDVDVYVSYGEAPTTTAYDSKSSRAGNNETVRITAPQAGTYYIKLVGKSAYSGVTLVARQ